VNRGERKLEIVFFLIYIVILLGLIMDVESLGLKVVNTFIIPKNKENWK
jgi:hypothetical protein